MPAARHSRTAAGTESGAADRQGRRGRGIRRRNRSAPRRRIGAHPIRARDAEDAHAARRHCIGLDADARRCRFVEPTEPRRSPRARPWPPRCSWRGPARATAASRPRDPAAARRNDGAANCDAREPARRNPCGRDRGKPFPSDRPAVAALARMPNSSRDAKATRQLCRPWIRAARKCRFRSIVSAIAMRFWVSVPVLSVHSNVAAPRVSIAAARRVSTCARDMRHAPITRKTVRTSGNLFRQERHAERDAAQEPVEPGTAQQRIKHHGHGAHAQADQGQGANEAARLGLQGRRRRISIVPSARPILPISLRGPVA